MLEKLFSFLLTIIGFLTPTMYGPVPPQTTNTATTSAVVRTNLDVKHATTSSETGVKTSTTKIATSTPKVAEKKPPQNPPIAPTTTTIATTTLPAVLPPPDFNAINTTARTAIVNIICTSATGGSFEPISGSGVMIDSRGIILTNAHVAQFLLLQNYHSKDFLRCVGRTGSPASPMYTLKILYISPAWVKENYTKITDGHATGTGENDFALLQITGRTNPDLSVPPNLPALSPDIDEEYIQSGNGVVLVGYPAGFLGGIAIQRDLYIVSSSVNIRKAFTFGTNTLDLFSLGGSPVAQQGASGGAVVSGRGKLLGIIVTSSDAAQTDARDLNAISLAHIDRSFSTDTGIRLKDFLAGDVTNFALRFSIETLPGLQKLVIDDLDAKNNR